MFKIQWRDEFAICDILAYINKRDDPSTLPSDDPFPRARMHHDRNAR